VSIDGPDNVGKSTTIEAVAEYIRDNDGPPCEIMQTLPKTSATVLEYIMPILEGKVDRDPYHLQMFMAVMCYDSILRAFERSHKALILLDRGLAANFVYAIHQGIDEDWIRAVHAHIPRPDSTTIILGQNLVQKAFDQKVVSVFDKDHEMQESLDSLFRKYSGEFGWHIQPNTNPNTGELYTPREMGEKVGYFMVHSPTFEEVGGKEVATFNQESHAEEEESEEGCDQEEGSH
jgi:thymidylate kinase